MGIQARGREDDEQDDEGEQVGLAAGVEWRRDRTVRKVPGLVGERGPDLGVQRPHRRTAALSTKPTGPTRGVRVTAGIVGACLAIATLVALVHALRAASPGSSPVMIAGGFLPAAMLLRYALTGAAKT